jgi:SAM-dependent methyltransferase
MSDYGPETYGERVADVYDEWFDAKSVPVEELARLAAGGPTLELGIGTGRVAVPLAALGVEVHGIDTSPAMVEKLHAKPGAAGIEVTIGDMADVAVDKQFALVFVVFNTFLLLLTQAEQLRCFRNVAARLRPGGRFVIEAFVPDVSRFTHGQALSAATVGTDAVRLDASRYDSLTQVVEVNQIHITERGIQLVPLKLRLVHPPELDLMAQLAGLELEHRWESFGREPFTADSPGHVSVYRLP